MITASVCENLNIHNFKGYHFVHEQYENMTQLVFSVKLLDTFLRSKLETVTAQSRRMAPDKMRMEAKYDMYRECFQVTYNVTNKGYAKCKGSVSYDFCVNNPFSCLLTFLGHLFSIVS